MTFTNEELRLLVISGPTWITMLRARAERTTAKMHADYRSGKTDHLASVAELVSIREQIKEIENALRANERKPQ